MLQNSKPIHRIIKPEKLKDEEEKCKKLTWNSQAIWLLHNADRARF